MNAQWDGWVYQAAWLQPDWTEATAWWGHKAQIYIRRLGTISWLFWKAEGGWLRLTNQFYQKWKLLQTSPHVPLFLQIRWWERSVTPGRGILHACSEPILTQQVCPGVIQGQGFEGARQGRQGSRWVSTASGGMRASRVKLVSYLKTHSCPLL